MRGFIGGLIIGLIIGVVLAVATPQTLTHIDTESVERKPGRKETVGTTSLPVDWRLFSIAPKDSKLSSGARRVARGITELTQSGVKITFNESDTEGEYLELFNAVSSGAIEAVFSNTANWGNKSHGFDFLSGIPFGPPGDEFLAWYHQGGGKQLADALFHRHNIHGLLCGLAGPITGSLFTSPVRSLADFQNKPIAAAGLGALVLRRAGAKVVTKPSNEILLSLRSGNVFGTTFSHALRIDRDTLDTSAKHLYFPGWAQQFRSYYLTIHLRDWSGLSRVAQTRIQAVCAENIVNGLASSEASQFVRLKQMINQGAHIREWPPKLLTSLKKIWAKEAQRLSRKDRDFQKLWSSLKTFSRDYRIWKELGYL